MGESTATAIPPVNLSNFGRPTSAHDIHNSYIEGGGACKPDKQTPGCFLTTRTRDLLVSGLQGRVNAALTMYIGALTEVGLEEKMKKDEDVDILMSLLIDAVGGVALTCVKRAAKWMRAANASKVLPQNLGFDVSDSPDDLDRARDANESTVNLALKSATDTAKREGKTAVAAGGGGEFQHDQAATGSFINQLKRQAASSFKHLREDPPNMLEDADLILLYHSWEDIMGHDQVTYAEAIRAKLASFRSSPASKIGRVDRSLHRGNYEDLDNDERREKLLDSKIRDTKLVLQKYADGTPADLMYYKRDYDHPLAFHQGSYDQSADISVFAIDDSWKPLKRVEDEFRDVAIVQNNAMWGYSYDVKEMSGRTKAPADYVPKIPAATNREPHITRDASNPVVYNAVPPISSPVMPID